MDKKVKTYDPKKVITTFSGIPLSGFADGSFIQVTASSDRYTKKIGADGEVARVRGNDDTSEVTITLLATSKSNTVLTSYLNADRLSNKGIAPLSITDLDGGLIFFWPQAWIRKTPDITKSKDIEEVAWVFDTGQIGAEIIAGDY